MPSLGDIPLPGTTYANEWGLQRAHSMGVSKACVRAAGSASSSSDMRACTFCFQSSALQTWVVFELMRKGHTAIAERVDLVCLVASPTIFILTCATLLYRGFWQWVQFRSVLVACETAVTVMEVSFTTLYQASLRSLMRVRLNSSSQ